MSRCGKALALASAIGYFPPLSTPPMKSTLITLLRTHSYKYDPEGRFQLVSGKLSRYYVNCKATTMRGDAADVVGALVADAESLLRERSPSRI